MGAAGRRRFESEFTVSRMIDAVEHLYAKLGVRSRQTA